MTQRSVPTVVHTADAPRDPRKRPFPVTLYDESDNPIDLSSGGGIPNPVPWLPLMPYAGPGVRDYDVVYPAEGFDSPAFYVAGGMVALMGVFETTNQSSGVIATMPPEARPTGIRSLVIGQASGTMEVYIEPSGQIKRAGGGIPNTWATLGGCYLL
jgi:hypothetical protein